jgi:hypothetical protein
VSRKLLTAGVLRDLKLKALPLPPQPLLGPDDAPTIAKRSSQDTR